MFLRGTNWSRMQTLSFQSAPHPSIAHSVLAVTVILPVYCQGHPLSKSRKNHTCSNIPLISIKQGSEIFKKGWLRLRGQGLKPTLIPNWLMFLGKSPNISVFSYILKVGSMRLLREEGVHLYNVPGTYMAWVSKYTIVIKKICNNYYWEGL